MIKYSAQFPDREVLYPHKFPVDGTENTFYFCSEKCRQFYLDDSEMVEPGERVILAQTDGQIEMDSNCDNWECEKPLN